MSRACEACQHVNDDATQFCGRCGQKLSGLILAIGATLDRGRYRLEKLLGEGGMGSIWQAHDTKLGRSAALKCLAAELTAHPTARRRMEQEAKILARVEHPNIVQVRNVFDESGILVMELEFVSGGDLESMVRPGGASEPAVLGRMVKVLAGLEALHSAGLVHRDIKPANVLLTDGGEPKITDLGVAHDPTAREKTRLGASLGTPDYMSPEQIQGMKVDARSDLYSMGVMAFQLLAGELPFVGNSEFDIHAAHVREPPDLARLRAVASPAAVDWIARALEKDPAARWQSAADMRKAAERVLAGKASGATAASPARTPAPVAAPARQAPASATQRAAEREDPGSGGTGMGFLRLALIAVGLWPACLAVAIPTVMLSGSYGRWDLPVYGAMALATSGAILVPWGLGRWRGASLRATKLPWFLLLSAVMFIIGCVLALLSVLVTGFSLEDSSPPHQRQPVTGAKCVDDIKDEIPKAWKARFDSCQSLDRSVLQNRSEYWGGTASVDKAICKDLVSRVRKTKVGEAKGYCRWDDPAGWAPVRCSKLKMKGMKRCLQCEYTTKTNDTYILYVGVDKACSRATIFSGVNEDPSVLTER